MQIKGKLKQGHLMHYIETGDGMCYFIHDVESTTHTEETYWQLSEQKTLFDTYDHRFLGYSYKATFEGYTYCPIVKGRYFETNRYGTGGVGYIKTQDGEKVYVSRVSDADGTTGEWAISHCLMFHERDTGRSYIEPILLRKD